MKIDIFANHIELTPAIKDFIEKKIGSLSKYTGGVEKSNARVEISLPSRHHHSGEIFYAEGNLNFGGTLLRAETENKDLYAAITVVRDELQEQITKFKEKKTEKGRSPRK